MNFEKFYNKYDSYSFVQQKVAEKLVDYIDEKKIDTAFEIGCGTGYFTKIYTQKINIKKLFLNDMYYPHGKLDGINNFEFIEGNIEKIEIPKSDIIFSSSVFQWIKNLDELFFKLSKSSDYLVFSIYVDGNLIEIKNHFGVSLNYKSCYEIKEIAEKYFDKVEYTKDTIVLKFDKSIDALRHLKYTGVTNIEKNISISKIKSFKDEKLTYEVAYFVCKNQK